VQLPAAAAKEPSFKSAYLIHGDDHGGIVQRRARLRALAEEVSGPEGVEIIEGEAATPEAVAIALRAMTFALGRRFIIVDGAERFGDKAIAPLLEALRAIPPETTVAFFAREEARLTVSGALVDAVRAAGGQVEAQRTVKPWELPRWVAERARGLGIELDADAARALVQHVGDRPQRLQRELEKLALDAGPGGRLTADEVEQLTAASGERKVWELADAVVAGDVRAAMQLYLALRSQGERVPGLIYWMAQRLRQAADIAARLEQGEAVGQIKRGLRMPSRAADGLIAGARNAGADRLRRGLEELADLELASRGGGPGVFGEDTAMVLALERIAR
jgi:DNA polymerase-3 subunit delta